MNEIEGSFEDWKRDTIKNCDQENVNWKTIGDWAYPTKKNNTYSEVLCHLCEEYKNKNNTNNTYLNFNKCGYCGMKVPDGIKMIALLEKL